jgi:excisionase family DNA binding protein
MTTPFGVDKLLYTPAEAAHALGVCRSTLYVLMANGDIPSIRIGSARRVPADGLRRYISKLSEPTANENAPKSRGASSKQQHLW